MDEHRPLDSLLPQLSRSEPIPEMTQGPEVHSQVFEVQLEDGHEWLYSIWREPEELSELESQLRRLLEVTQLLYLSHAADMDNPSDFTGVRLLVFDQLSVGAIRVLEGLGLTRTVFDPDAYRNRMTSLENQAMQAGWSIPLRPQSVWHAAMVRPDPALRSPLLRIDSKLRAKLEENRWGEVPGESSKLLAEQVKMNFGVAIEPNRAGMDQIDLLFLDHTATSFRWMLPSTFKSICDFVGVYLQASYPMRVGWAVGKKGADFPAPPLFRVTSAKGPRMFPIGAEIVRWFVLPADEAEAPKTLADHIEEALSGL